MAAQERDLPEQRLIRLQSALETDIQQSSAMLQEALKAYLAAAELQRETMVEILRLLQCRSVSKQEAADLIGVNYRTVLNMLEDGRLRQNPAGTIPLVAIKEFQEGKRTKKGRAGK